MKINRDRFLKWIISGAIGFGILVLFNPDLSQAEEISQLTASRLRCEYRFDPLGIDETRPRLDWMLSSPVRGERQSGYRILVATSRKNLDRSQGDLWDSGKVSGDDTAQIVYPGKPLASGQECFWKVMVWDAKARASEWSEPAKWSMGLLAKEDWKADWIGSDSFWHKLSREAYFLLTPFQFLYQPFGKIYLPCPYLRKSFSVSKPVKRATIYATSLGIYELYLNGERVGEDFFTPGWTDYRIRVYYQSYDVTEMIRSGENALGAILSDGWYAGNIASKGQRVYGSRLRLKAQLQLEYADGSTEIVATDQSWSATDGAIREADIQAGESYDARLEMPGWSEPGFDDRAWKPVDLGAEVSPLIQSYPGIPVRRTGEVKPVSISEPKPGVYVFHLGQNFAGRARLKVRGKRGDKVTLRFAEMLNPDGTIYTTNLRSARATDTYILKGGATELWEPSFTYHGFQYVEVAGYPGKPELDAITGIVLHSGLAITGSFETSNPLVNKIYSNLLWGQRSNYFEVPTDCPQRDERAGWMGDAQIFIRTASYNMDIAPFFTKWMIDVDDAQLPDGAFQNTSPTAYAGKAAGWADAGVICPWTIYRVYGDTRIIEKHYPAMAKYLEFMKARSPEDLSPALGAYGDWLNINDPTPQDFITTAYYGLDAELMSEMAQAIGKPEDASQYLEMSGKIKEAFSGSFVSSEGGVKGDSQTGYLMALGFGLLPADLRAKAGENLLRRIQESDWCISSGFLGAKYIMPVLTELGRLDIAYRLLLNTRYPSWGYSINQGATTIWERWNSYTKENGFNDPGMNSFNHYAFGSVGEWLFSSLAGIDTDGPGFKNIVIHPHPGGDLTWAKASYDSIRGPITVFWKLEQDEFKLEVSIPANTSATVYIPAPGPDSVAESNVPAKSSSGVKFLRMEQESSVWEIGSGKYSFAARQ